MLGSVRPAVAMLWAHARGNGWRYIAIERRRRAQAWRQVQAGKGDSDGSPAAPQHPAREKGASPSPGVLFVPRRVADALPNQLQAFIPRARLENPFPDLSRAFGLFDPFARFRLAAPPELCVRRIRCRNPRRAGPVIQRFANRDGGGRYLRRRSSSKVIARNTCPDRRDPAASLSA
jgi:hypothetical protein